MAEGNASTKVELKSTDGKIFKVDKDALVKASGFFRSMTETEGLEDQETSSSIPVQLDSFNLDLIAKWAEYNKDLVRDPIDVKLEETSCVFISKGDFEFIRHLNKNQLLSLAQAAQYMDISSLLKLCQKRMACFYKYKTADTIRKMMKLVNDFTNQEENSVRKENEWFEDKITLKF